MKKTISIVLALVMILSLFASCGQTEKPAATTPDTSAPSADAPSDDVVVLRTCTQNPETSITTIVTRYFAKRVEEISEGKMKIDVYINAEFGSEQSVMEQVMTGTLEMAPISTSVLANVVPEVGIYSLPFLFPNMEVYASVTGDPAFQEVVFGAIQDQTGVVCLGGIQATGRGVSNTKHPVKTVDDLKGLKIRTIGSSAINDSFEAMGATTTAVAWKEVYTALQQGLCDGEDSTVNANLSMKFIEYTKYFTELNEIFQDLLVIVNGSVWAGLTPEQQAVLTQASKDAFAYGMEYSAQYRQEGFDQVAAEYPDFQIIKHEDISPEDYATFYDAATTVWPKYTEAIGEEVFNLTKGLVEQYS